MGVFPSPTTGGGGAPTGPAGGVLGGTYPDPAFAADMATQAELDAGLATKLGATAAAGGVLNGNYPNPGFAADMATQAELDAGLATKLGATAAAGGVLNGNYPNPGFAADMATQAELDAAVAAIAAVVAPLNVTVATKAASFTLALADNNDLLLAAHATVAIVCTLPTNAAVAIPIGAQFQITRAGAAAVSFAASGGVTLNSKTGVTPAIQAQWTSASATKTATDEWLVEGNL